jgi:hypothetical protein
LKHINNSNKKYDIIIRLRFDQFIWTDDSILNNLNTIENRIIFNEENTNSIIKNTQDKIINFDEIMSNSIYIFGYGDFLHYKYANDQFWYHNSSLIKIMSKFYDNILNLLKYCNKYNIGNKGAMIECIFYNYLIKNNIAMKKTNIKGIFIREYL